MLNSNLYLADAADVDELRSVCGVYGETSMERHPLGSNHRETTMESHRMKGLKGQMLVDAGGCWRKCIPANVADLRSYRAEYLSGTIEC